MHKPVSDAFPAMSASKSQGSKKKKKKARNSITASRLSCQQLRLHGNWANSIHWWGPCHKVVDTRQKPEKDIQLQSFWDDIVTGLQCYFLFEVLWLHNHLKSFLVAQCFNPVSQKSHRTLQKLWTLQMYLAEPLISHSAGVIFIPNDLHAADYITQKCDRNLG